MAASCGGHVNIARMLIESKAQLNTQAEVCCFYHQKTHCTLSSHSVLYFTVAVEVHECISVHSMAGLLFTWQLRKETLMW